jgi:thiol-disulfide isomerase/thioredoxin
MKKTSPLWVFAIVVIFILIILNLVFSIRISETKKSISELNNSVDFNFSKKITLQNKCPDSFGGNDKAYLRIKYFYTDYCPWCKKQEPILQKMISEYGHLVYIEWFNTLHCKEVASNYSVSGVPTLVFSTYDENKEYSHYGFTSEKDLKKLICDVTGGC